MVWYGRRPIMGVMQWVLAQGYERSLEFATPAPSLPSPHLRWNCVFIKSNHRMGQKYFLTAIELIAWRPIKGLRSLPTAAIVGYSELWSGNNAAGMIGSIFFHSLSWLLFLHASQAFNFHNLGNPHFPSLLITHASCSSLLNLCVRVYVNVRAHYTSF